MKPRRVLTVLDRHADFLEKHRDKAQPGTKHFDMYQEIVVAIRHASRLVAFECQHINTKMELGEYKNNRKTGEFLAEVVREAPQEGAP